LNEPAEAESICLDVLAVDTDNQHALVTLLLARTDHFGERLGAAVRRAEEVIPRLHDAYARAYYTGIVCERHAKARLANGAPRQRRSRRGLPPPRPVPGRNARVEEGRGAPPPGKRRPPAALDPRRADHERQPPPPPGPAGPRAPARVTAPGGAARWHFST